MSSKSLFFFLFIFVDFSFIQFLFAFKDGFVAFSSIFVKKVWTAKEFYRGFLHSSDLIELKFESFDNTIKSNIDIAKIKK